MASNNFLVSFILSGTGNAPRIGSKGPIPATPKFAGLTTTYILLVPQANAGIKISPIGCV